MQKDLFWVFLRGLDTPLRFCEYFSTDSTIMKSETYSEICQTPMMEHFANIINDQKPFTGFAKCFILDAWQGFEYKPDSISLLFLFVVHERMLKSLNVSFCRIIWTQPGITCSKLTIETQEQGVKYVQS